MIIFGSNISHYLIVFLLLLASLSSTGCSSISKNHNEMTRAEIRDFFEKRTEGKAILYFTCGTWVLETTPSPTTNLLPLCQFRVDEQQYKPIWKNEIGRVDVSPGKITLKSVQPDPMAISNSLAIDINEEDTVLITQHLLQNQGHPKGRVEIGGTYYTIEFSHENIHSKIREFTPRKIK